MGDEMIRSMEHMKKFEIVATDGRIGALIH